ncbi:MAG TPA: cytochrome c biogenesis protein CcsA [Clostridia bacterium]|nr:cytochrome c biogenesis protein CcsA [Clostridia bacterium]
MPLFWLRIATVFYGIGLLYAVLLLSKKGDWLSRIAVPAVGLGMVFHFVSLAETAILYGYQDLLTIRHAESALAWLIVVIFMVVYARFRTSSPGLFIFPLAFLLTFGSAFAQRPVEFSSPMLRSGWILAHVCMLLIGYASLFLSFVASLLYLLQAHSLKSKQPIGLLSRMPALQVIDDLGYRALLLGFPFMTLGLVAGSVVAQSRFGVSYFSDPKVLLSLIMWGVYVVLLYTRWNSGWRGRKAAYLATFAFIAAVCAWAANYLSSVHRFVAP